MTLGDGGDNLIIEVVDDDAEISTGDGNDDVTINNNGNSGTVDTGSGADDIVLKCAAWLPVTKSMAAPAPTTKSPSMPM